MARCGCGCTCIVQSGEPAVHVTGDGSSLHPFTITFDQTTDVTDLEATVDSLVTQVADLTARVIALESGGGGGGGGGVDGGSP